MFRRFIPAVFLAVIVVLVLPSGAEAQDLCKNKVWCSSEGCWKCIADTASGWEYVSGGNTCHACKIVDCEEMGRDCPIEPIVPEAEAIAAWEDATISAVNVDGVRLVLFAEVPPNYPPLEDVAVYSATLRAQCEARQALILASDSEQPRQ